MDRRHIVLAVILLIVAAFSMNAATPEPIEPLTISAGAAVTTDVEHGDAFIRPEGLVSPVVSRVSEDVVDPEVDVKTSETAANSSSPDRQPVSYRPAGIRRAILGVYRI